MTVGKCRAQENDKSPLILESSISRRNKTKCKLMELKEERTKNVDTECSLYNRFPSGTYKN